MDSESLELAGEMNLTQAQMYRLVNMAMEIDPNMTLSDAVRIAAEEDRRMDKEHYPS